MADNKFRYLNEKCPVCNKQFGLDDDIVVCPYCGTPHHRECYKQNGNCANNGKHQENFRWEPDFVAPEEITETPLQEQPSDIQRTTVVPPFAIPVPMVHENPFVNLPSEIADDVKTEEAALFVRQDALKYITRFFKIKENRKTWNWAAFFFAPYWFFYRKMYKLGAIFMALTLLLTIGINMLPPVQTLYNDITEWTEKYNTEDAEDFTKEEIQQAYTERNEIIMGNPTGAVLVIVQATLSLAIQILVGLKANKWYYTHTVKEIRKINSENPGADNRILLIRRGGVSYSTAFLSLLAEKAVIMLIEIILSGSFH